MLSRRWFLILLLGFILLPAAANASTRPVVIVISKSDLKDAALGGATDPPDDSPEWDEFGDPDSKSEDELDPGSWHAIFEPSYADASPPAANSPADSAGGGDTAEAVYSRGVRGMIAAVAGADPVALEEAAGDIEAASALGYPHAQSTLGFLYGAGIMRRQSRSKAFLHHHFAAEGSNMQSKMALAYTYFRQEMYEKSVKLYAELAEAAVASFMISKEPPVLEPVRLHVGVEENKEALRKFHGEEDEDFQVIEYQAVKGNAMAMYKVGMFYYFGLRGIRRDYDKALYWFSKAADKGDAKSMEFLGEIYASGAGVEKNYTEALFWLTRASKHKHFSAYNGLGYLYTKGLGVEKNYTTAKEYFEKAAGNDEPGGHYNLGILYLKGIGVKRDIAKACKYFLAAANVGQPKALYQVAKMFQKGIGFEKNVFKATILFKVVAERGPWSSLSRWALESYLKGEVGKALLLYSRLAELGYEVAQSNAAWILDKYEEHSLCMGESGFCTENERHIHSHSLWWQASEQGNEHAALLIGDAYYYGRGTERDYERAAEAYMRALSQSNAQAMFNLGYMHEHGEGLPYDLHLAKRYYDQALENDPDAKLPVTLALTSLWIRKNYGDSFLVHVIDSLPEIFPRVEAWVDDVLLEEGNATILTLFVCLLTVLYLRDRQRRHAVIPPPQPEVNDHNR